jgi:hypothetical protein
MLSTIGSVRVSIFVIDPQFFPSALMSLVV